MADLETTECEDHFLINCVTCKERQKPKPPITESTHDTVGFKRGDPTAFVAQFDGRCAICEGEILAQTDMIVRHENGWRHYPECP